MSKIHRLPGRTYYDGRAAINGLSSHLKTRIDSFIERLEEGRPISFAGHHGRHTAGNDEIQVGDTDELPLPAGTQIVGRDWDVGTYEGASNLCEDVAFVIVSSNQSKASILDFYKVHLTGTEWARFTDRQCQVNSVDDLPESTPSPITDFAKHIPPNQRATTYVILAKDAIDENSWDPRGW